MTVVIKDSTAGPLSIFDQGGILNFSSNGGYYQAGLQVAPDGSGVFLHQVNAKPSDDPFTNQRLINSTGLGTAHQVGPTLNQGKGYNWGSTLTYNPADNRYYVTANTGIWGFDPAGGVATRFDGGGVRVDGADGMFFSADGNTAYVASDDASPGAYFSVTRGGTPNPLIIKGNDWDSLVRAQDGTPLIVADTDNGLLQPLSDGSVKKVFDPKPYIRPNFWDGYGPRVAVDPVTGDLFETWYWTDRQAGILRIKSDFSSASTFALVDANPAGLAFGPSSSDPKKSESLYFSVNDAVTGIGTIYEVPMGPLPPGTKLPNTGTGTSSNGSSSNTSGNNSTQPQNQTPSNTGNQSGNTNSANPTLTPTPTPNPSIGNGNGSGNSNSPGDPLGGSGTAHVLMGGTGDDTLKSSVGNDTLTGGGGADRFVFDLKKPFKRTVGTDTITDFQRPDKIVLDETTFTALKAVALKGHHLASFASVKTIVQAKRSKELITYNRNTGALYYNQNGNKIGFGKGGQFAVLANGFSLNASDFVLQH